MEAGETTSAPAVEVEGLTKSYGGVVVLDHVSLAVAPAEVHALLGENGAGKSTLIKVLSGVVRADAGTVRVGGVPVAIHVPRDAQRLGIATLHQELSVVPGLSVAENIFLGQRVPQRLGKVRWSVLNARAEALLASLGQDLDVRADAGRLTPVGKTMTALARALAQDARLLVLDEPTAALTDQETSQLFAAMRRLQEQEVGVLYVSHRLEEVLEVCHTYTVLRNGRKVSGGDVADATVTALVTAMAGRPVEAIFPPRAGRRGEVLLEVHGLTGQKVRGVDVVVHRGEVLGIAGLAGSGRSEVVRLLAGGQRRRHGRVVLRGAPHDPRTIRQGHRAGVALVPQERRVEGLVPDSVEFNTTITTLQHHTHGRTVLSRSKASRHAEGMTGRLGVRMRSLRQPVLHLSGGNQQKVVLAKFLALSPDVLLLDEPTRGVDVATKSEIYHLVRDHVAGGHAAVVVSSELPELLGLCDHILVLHEGRQVGVYDASSVTEDELLHACYGRPAA